jgi:hypothetical protein
VASAGIGLHVRHSEINLADDPESSQSP